MEGGLVLLVGGGLVKLGGGLSRRENRGSIGQGLEGVWVLGRNGGVEVDGNGGGGGGLLAGVWGSPFSLAVGFGSFSASFTAFSASSSFGCAFELVLVVRCTLFSERRL